MIVSEQAGTTRDAIDMPLTFAGRELILVDTAGLRRQAKVGESLEYYTSLRSRRAAERADVALVVCDARGRHLAGPAVAELAMKSGCATALVLNKWDAAEDVDLDHERARAHRSSACARGSSPPARRPGVTSTGCWSRRWRSPTAPMVRIPTSQLNRFLADAVAARQPPSRRGHRLKLLYMTQTGERPPRFAVQVNSRQHVTRDYAYFLENRLRERYRLEGIPFIIDFVERGQRRA